MKRRIEPINLNHLEDSILNDENYRIKYELERKQFELELQERDLKKWRKDIIYEAIGFGVISGTFSGILAAVMLLMFVFRR